MKSGGGELGYVGLHPPIEKGPGQIGFAGTPFNKRIVERQNWTVLGKRTKCNPFHTVNLIEFGPNGSFFINKNLKGFL